MTTASCLLQTCFSVLLLGMVAYLAPVLHAGRSNRCTRSTSPVTIHEVVGDGEARVICSGTVHLFQCEGQCRSWEFPSATTSNGFDRVAKNSWRSRKNSVKNSWSPYKSNMIVEKFGKGCKCCQERNMQTRTVWISECRDAPQHEGGVLIPDYPAIPVEVTEPSECRCQVCSF